MRFERIEFTIKLPLTEIERDSGEKTYYKDANGVLYDPEAVKEACEKTGSLPIRQYDPHGKETVTGIAESIEYTDGSLLVKGFFLGGGTSEAVSRADSGEIYEMVFKEIGLM